MNIVIRALSAALAVVSLSAAAGALTPGLDRRKARQQQRIDEGIASGQLTDREVLQLRRGQDELWRAERAAKSDGKITPQERKRLRRLQDKQDHRIAREKHDRERR